MLLALPSGHYYWIETWHQAIDSEKPTRGPECSGSVLPLRWHVANGAIWIASSIVGDAGQPGAEGADRYELADLLKGRLVRWPGDKGPQSLTYGGFASARHLAAYRLMAGGAKFPTELHYDYLPGGQFKPKLVVLRNFGGRVESAGEGGLLAAMKLIQSDEDEAAPRWSMTCYAFRTRFDRKVGGFFDEGWTEEGKLEGRFKEAFQALSKGDDYYFVTASGKLFRAARPAKRGQTRKVEPVWTDSDRPVTAFVTDADTDRTFLFCKPAKAGGKPSYFELGPKPRPVEYDPKSVKAPKATGPLGTVLLCARVLVADKKVKLPAKK